MSKKAKIAKHVTTHAILIFLVPMGIGISIGILSKTGLDYWSQKRKKRSESANPPHS